MGELFEWWPVSHSLVQDVFCCNASEFLANVSDYEDIGTINTTLLAVSSEPEVEEVVATPRPGAVNRFNSAGYLDNLAVAVPMGISLYALSLLTFVGNAMVLHAIRTERRLQTVSNMFIMSLAVADLTVGMIVMPISSAYAITGDWRFGIIVCQFWLSADYTASTASILNLLILSLDRYWSIKSPLKYIRKRTKRRALVMIGIVWIISAMWIMPIIGWHYIYSSGIRRQPSNVCETEFADKVLFKLSASTANFYVPMVLMMCLYAKIFYEIKKRSKFEIGQCNVPSNYEETGNGRAAGLSRNNSRTSLSRDINRLSRRRYLCSSDFDGSFRSDYHHSNLSRQSSSSSGEKRFNRLTLLTLRTNGSGSSTPIPEKNDDLNSQYFQGITVNIEYVNDDDENSEKSVVGPPVGENHVASASVTDKAKHGRKTKKLGKKETVNKKDTLELELKKPKESLLDLDEYQGGCKRTNSRSSNSLMPNLTALRMRVTRKNFASNLRQEKKAARQLGVIMGAFILCWLPYIIIFIVTAYCEDCISSQVHTATIWLGYLNSTMNPFLYALCNRNFKRAFKNMFRRGSKSKYFFPSSANNKTDHLFA